MSETKHCKRCDQTKPLSAYFKDVSRPDGVSFYCRLCYTAYSKSKYERLRDTEHYKERRRANQRRYYERHKEVAAAHKLAKLHKDKIMKPVCEGCGTAEGLHMHHPDHSKPLEVMTLCVLCHEKQHHKEIV